MVYLFQIMSQKQLLIARKATFLYLQQNHFQHFVQPYGPFIQCSGVLIRVCLPCFYPRNSCYMLTHNQLLAKKVEAQELLQLPLFPEILYSYLDFSAMMWYLSHNYLTRAAPTLMSDPLKEVLSAVHTHGWIVRPCSENLLGRFFPYLRCCLQLFLALFWQSFCEQSAIPSIPISIPSQIAVDYKSVHLDSDKNATNSYDF